MKIIRQLRHLFHPKRDLMPIFSQQAAFLCQTSEALCHMLSTMDTAEWKRIQKEMHDILKQERESQKMLKEAFKGIGYGIENNI